MEMQLPEIVAAGIYNTDAAVKNRTETRKRRVTMPEIEIPLSEGGIGYIDSDAVPYRTDTLICSKPGMVRHSRVPYRCRYVHFMLKEGELLEMFMELPTFLQTEKPEVYLALLEKIDRYHNSNRKSDSLMVQSAMLELIWTLRGDAKAQRKREQQRHSNETVIEGVIHHIQENLTGDLSLKTVAELARLSPIHVHNCFKASTGRTLREYVEEQRIRKACGLLLSTDWTLTRIAQECGFASQSYFSFAFKRKMEMTPREYARSMAERYGNG